MRRLLFLPVLLLVSGTVSAHEDGRSVHPPTEVPLGVLGHRLGSLLTIEGLEPPG